TYVPCSESRTGGNEEVQSRGLHAQRLFRPGRQHPRYKLQIPVPRARGRPVRASRWGRSEHQVAVGTSHPEGGHGRERCVHGPGLTPGLDLQIQRFQVDVRVGFGEVSGGWELPVGEAEYEFDQAHDARGTFQVADIGLDRTNTQWFLPTLSEHGAERSGF